MRFMCAPAWPASIFPTAVDPVNVIFATVGLVVNSSPIGFGSLAVTRLTTPFGIPASSKILNISIAHNGVVSAGFSTIQHPAARAGAIFRVIIEMG